MVLENTRILDAMLLLTFMYNSFMKGNAFTRPHIVFVVADDLGYNDVGYHGKTEIKTPCIDRLAFEGIRLENYYVQPTCTPSRSQLMSGRYQIHTGLQHRVIMRMQPNALPLDNIILPEQLKRCGYRTYMVGKWHLGFYKKEFLPWNRGFDRFLGILCGGADYFTRVSHQGKAEGIDFHDSEIGPINKYIGNYSTELYTDKANEFIKNHNKKRPMFLYLAHQAVHAPMQKPLTISNDYSNIKNDIRRNYAHMVSALDSSVCSVVQQLKRERMWENTIFIFSTDNGAEIKLGGSNWPLRGGKRTYFEGGIRGVGFIAGEAITGKTSINRKLFHVSNWMPTLMQGARCSLHPKTLPLDGINQWQSLKHNLPSKRKEILHNIDPLNKKHYKTEKRKLHKLEKNLVNKTKKQINFEFDVTVTAAIRNGPWKLLTGTPGRGKWIEPPEYSGKAFKSEWTGPYELFNIDEDPFETTNVAFENPKIVEFLLQRLSTYNETAVPVTYPNSDKKADPKYHNGFWVPWVT